MRAWVGVRAGGGEATTTYSLELHIVTQLLLIDFVGLKGRELLLKLVEVASIATLSSSRGLLLPLESFRKTKAKEEKETKPHSCSVKEETT